MKNWRYVALNSQKFHGNKTFIKQEIRIISHWWKESEFLIIWQLSSSFIYQLNVKLWKDFKRLQFEIEHWLSLHRHLAFSRKYLSLCYYLFIIYLIRSWLPIYSSFIQNFTRLISRREWNWTLSTRMNRQKYRKSVSCFIQKQLISSSRIDFPRLPYGTRRFIFFRDWDVAETWSVVSRFTSRIVKNNNAMRSYTRRRSRG